MTQPPAQQDDRATPLRPTVRTTAVPAPGASLERRLPVLMIALLAAVVASSLALTYGTLTRTAEEAAYQRLKGSTKELAASVVTATDARIVSMEEAARDPEVAEAIREGRPTRRPPAALTALLRPVDSLLPVELWTAAGVRIASTAIPVRSQLPGEISPAASPPAQLVLPRDGERAALGRLFPEGDRVRFWTTVPVRDGGRVVGYIAQKRQVGGPRNVNRTLGGLLGQEVAIYLHNDDGSQWTVGPGDPTSAPARATGDTSARMHLREGVEHLAVTEPIAGTPWRVVLESPRRAVNSRSRRTLVQLALISGAVLLLGALLAWAISRRITRPLAEVTVAAEGIARGEFSRRVAVKGGDELGRLATSFNRMAEQVDQSRKELERRMSEAEVARSEAEDARRLADEANLAKSQFLATMSHELRTPLNAIAGYTDLIAMGIYGPVTEQQQQALQRINRSQGHLLRLINDVLHFVKLTAGQVPYTVTAVPLASALAELEDLVAPQMQAKRLEFRMESMDPALLVSADREKLQQIVLNLLSNAVKFTPEAGTITVGATVHGDQVFVEVRDTGIGIPSERLEDVFDAFVQVDRAFHRPSEGIGLGLAISRDLARGMGGDLTVSSETDRGAVFTLVLPLARSGRAASRAAR